MRAISQQSTTDLRGTIIQNRFEVGPKIGTGGMATVYEGRQLDLERKVAIKIISRSNHNPSERRRFQNESKMLCKIDHPNVVKVFAAGDTQEFDFIVMDYASGKSLAALLTERKFSAEETLLFAQQMVAALAALHENKILHRDVKPQNIMISGEGDSLHAILVDFGIAKNAGADEQKLTKTGSILGTPLYMSPEQCASRGLDERSDIYSLGCVLYEMLAGKPPFVGETAFAVFHGHMHEPAPRLELDPGSWFAAVLQKMLSKNPDERYQSMNELAAALRARVTPEAIQHRAASPRTKWQHAAVLAAFVIAPSAGAWFWATQKSPRESVQEPSLPAASQKAKQKAETRERNERREQAHTRAEIESLINEFYARPNAPEGELRTIKRKLGDITREHPRDASDLYWLLFERETMPEKKLDWGLYSVTTSMAHDPSRDVNERMDTLNAQATPAGPRYLDFETRLGSLNHNAAVKSTGPVAIRYREQAARHCKNSHNYRQAMNEFLAISSNLQNEGRLVEAAEMKVEAFQVARQEKNPDTFAKALNGLSTAAASFYLLGEYEKALNATRLSIAETKTDLPLQKNPDLRRLLLSRQQSSLVVSAYSYHKLGDAKAAKKECELACKIKPLEPELAKKAYLMLAAIEGGGGNVASMESWLDKAANLTSTRHSQEAAECYSAVSDVFKKYNNQTRARDYASLAVENADRSHLRKEKTVQKYKQKLAEI